jgi:hypothetical protein
VSPGDAPKLGGDAKECVWPRPPCAVGVTLLAS